MKKSIFIIFCSVFLFASTNGQSDIEYLNKGIIKYLKEDYQGAISDFNKAIELNPKYAEAYYNRGIAKFVLGQDESACLDWSKAGELGPYEAYKFIKEYCK